MTNSYRDTAPAGAPRTRLTLDSGWSFRSVGEDRWLPAQVPGSNMTDLLRHGRIDDPFHRDNELRLQWVEECDWEYRCLFQVSADDLTADDLALVFDGLDTHCTVLLNGAPLLTADNMFHSHRVACRDRLRVGENELFLLFRSPVILGAERQRQDGFLYPAENDKTASKASVYSRKAPYHFGWDWGPKAIPSGVWRPVHLDIVRTARIVDVAHHIRALDAASAEIAFTVTVEGYVAGDILLTLGCDQPGVGPISLPVSLRTGQQTLTLVVRIDHPRLWWPNGLGEPFLHRFALTLGHASGEEIDQVTRAIGLRTVEVVNEPDAQGLSFYVKVNGQPVFMKGANYIPPDSFQENMTPDRHRRLFRDVVDANMNMLRIWGGGVYESDLFYDLADEHGVLIWQDFMFSCTLYPSDDAFLESVTKEAVQAVKRLRHHACLALWCGNNEITMGIQDWDWPGKFGYTPAHYAAMVQANTHLFDALLPGIVANHDPGRFYLPSSPIGLWENPADDSKGDGHYWGVWHGELPFDTYDTRLSRFMSEYGFQSYPLFPSVERFTEPQDRAVGSPVLDVHQKHPRGNAIITRFIRQHFGEPLGFPEFCYLSQMVQADGLRVAFEAHRRNQPFCMGSLYWQLNDCWPAISWSSIDYYGRWKALHYQAARSFAPLILSATVAGNGLDIHAISDGAQDIAGRLQARVIDLEGRVSWTMECDVVVPAGASTCLHHLAPPAGDLLLLHLTGADGLPVTKVHPLRPLTGADLPEPGLTLSVSDEGGIQVRAARYARGVLVLAGAADGDSQPINFTDNFFDLLPGQEKLIHPRGGRVVDPSSLQVISIHGAIRHG